MQLGDPEVAALAAAANEARQRARTYGGISVGAAVLTSAGTQHVGCNIEHKFRSHDIHAEVCALAGMIAAGGDRAICVVVASDQSRFTPCGSCMDWIFELGGPDCLIVISSEKTPMAIWRADQLMPLYPIE